MDSRVLVFLRRFSAHGAGHVGWAFADDTEMYLVGSVENPPGTFYTAPAEMGFWIKRMRDPIVPMRARHYAEFKLVHVAESDPAYARRVAAWVSQQPYEVIGRNCMDAAYDVLRAYGARELPLPARHWEPKHWFDLVAGIHYQIDSSGIAQETDKPHPTVIGPELADNAILGAEPPITDAPSAPGWRVPGSAEALAFEAALLALTPPPNPVGPQQQRPLPATFIAKLRHWFGLAHH